MTQKVKNVFAFVPAMLWYGVIWSFSAQTATQSGGTSDGLLHTILSGLVPAYEGALPEVQIVAVEALSFFIRKGAHMTCYFILAALLLAAVCLLVRSIPKRCAIVVMLCVLLAGLDEFHQTFVPGRSGEIRDVCIDGTGGVLALGLWLVLRWILKKETRYPIWGMGGLACLCGVLAKVLPPLVQTSFIRWLGESFVEGWNRYPVELQSELAASVVPIVSQLLQVGLIGLTGFFVLLTGLAVLAVYTRKGNVNPGAH